MNNVVKFQPVPTAEGLLRYSHTGGYYETHGETHACTCKPTCEWRCAGECGCEACSLAFVEFCDVAGFVGFAPWNGRSEQEALDAYRQGHPSEPDCG